MSPVRNQPSGARTSRVSSGPIVTLHHARAAHLDFAVGGDAHLHAGIGLPTVATFVHGGQFVETTGAVSVSP